MAWPTSVATNSDLHLAVNNVNTTLNGAIDNVTTTVVLTDASAFPTAGYVTIGSEAIRYTGKSVNTLTGVTRGADGTTAAAHSHLSPVFHHVVAAHHNVLKDELIAIENDLNTRIGTGATSNLKVVAGTVSDPAIEFPSGNGIYDAGVGGVQIARSGNQAVRFDTTTLFFDPVDVTGVLSISAGTVSLPGLTQTSDTNTGLYFPVADSMAVTVGGSNVVTFQNDGTARQIVATNSTGSGSRPSYTFSGSLTSGISNSGSTINIMNSGSNNYTFSSSGVFQGNFSNSISSPAIQNILDTNTGIAWSAADTLDIATGGLSRIKVTSTGQSQFSGDLNTQSTHTAKLNSLNSNTTLGNHEYVTVDASGGAITITLPALSGITGRMYYIKKIDSSANNVIIDGDASENIDGTATKSFNTQYQSYTVVAGASEWHVF